MSAAAASAPTPSDLSALLPVFNALPGAYLLLSPDLRIEAASDAYLAATLTGRADLLGRNIFEAFPDNPAAPTAQATHNLRTSLVQVLATRRPHEMAPQHYDVPDPARPGRFVERHWLPRNTPVLDEQGRVRHIIHAVVNLTEQVAAEAGLRESQAREQAAYGEANRQREQLHNIFEQAPALICIFEGPAHVFQFVNAPYQALVGNRPLLGRPIAEAMPELAGQPFFGLLDRVYQTGETFHATEMPVQLDPANPNPGPGGPATGRALEKRYYNFIYQARHNLAGATDGILVFAYDVTPQVLAREQVQRLNDRLALTNEELAVSNEELAATNEELQAANEEFLTNNAELLRAQQALRQLNEELEERVAERTQQAQAARAAAEAGRERLEHLFMEAPVAICILTGPQLRYELVNPSYQQLFPDRPLLGLPLLRALPELRGQPVYDALQDVYQTGRTHVDYTVAVPLAHAAAGPPEEVYFTYIFQARHGEHGRVDGVIVFAFEVTEQVRTRQRADALQAEVLAAAQWQAQERETFYQVFAETPAAICIQRGPEHRYEYLNAAYQQFFPDRALRGRPVAEALPEIVPAGILALLDGVYRTGETYFGHEVPLTLEPPDGGPPQQRHFTFTYQAYRENGQIAGISTFAYDVSEQVLARQQREAQQRQLRELFEQAPVAICVFRGPDYVLDVVNSSMGQMWDRAPAGLIGQPFFDAMPELEGQGLRELLDEVRRTGIPFAAQEQAVRLARHGPGETGYYNYVYQPLHDEHGRLTAIACVATEVSEQVLARQLVGAANQELTATNQQLTRVNVDLDNFIYTASHDLKAPITNIEGLLLALQSELPPAGQPGDVPQILTLMQGAVERFKTTIDYLSEVVKLQKEHDQPATDVALAAIVDDVRLDLAPLIHQTGARLEAALTDSPSISFSVKNLRSVVYNLLSNALKYRHPDRPPLVRVDCQLAGDYAVLTVQDNGLGLEPDRQQELFTMFRRLHSHVEGSGLGLYMVKKMVENAGGRVGVASELGVGTTFSVYFRR